MWHCRPHAPRASQQHCVAALVLFLCSFGAHARQQHEALQLQLQSGSRVTVDLRIPQARTAPMAAVMVLGGFDAGQVLDALPPALPVMLASFEYPYRGPRRLDHLRDLRGIPEVSRSVGETFEAIGLLTAALRQRDDVDPDRIGIVGASLGAPFATIAAERFAIPDLVVIHGFGQLDAVIARQFERRLQPRYGRWIIGPCRLAARLLVWALDLPSPDAAARRLRSGQRVLMITASDDRQIPRSAVEVLWQALLASDASVERRDMPGSHLRGGNDPRIVALTRSALAWLDRSADR